MHDPIADPVEAEREYHISLIPWDHLPHNADAIVVAVPHQGYVTMPVSDLSAWLKKGGVFVDIKSVYDPRKIKEAGYNFWRL